MDVCGVRRAFIGCSRSKKLLNFPEYFHETVDFLGRVVEVKTRARRRFHAELLHQRLVAMMAAAQCYATLIGHSHDVMSMNVFQEETHQTGAADAWTEEPDALELAKF